MMSGRSANLTARQREVFDFIASFAAEHGSSPTLREIADHFQLSSTNGVLNHLKALEAKGLIRRNRGRSRLIEIVAGPPRQLDLPLLGVCPENEPFRPAASTESRVNLSQLFTAEGTCCIRVDSDHLEYAGVQRGDLLLIRRRQYGPSGSLVAALDARHELMICRSRVATGQLVSVEPPERPVVTRQVLGPVSGVLRCCGAELVEMPESGNGD